MEQWINFIGKEIKIVFEDGENHYSTKKGKLIIVSPTHAVIESENKIHGISLSKIIRFEVDR